MRASRASWAVSPMRTCTSAPAMPAETSLSTAACACSPGGYARQSVAIAILSWCGRGALGVAPLRLGWPRFVSGRVDVRVGRAAPLAKCGKEGGRINRLALRCRMHDVHGDAQLSQVRLTAAAAGDMAGEALALLAWEACLEVLGRELHDVPAREPTASHGHVLAPGVARVGFVRGILVAGLNAASQADRRSWSTPARGTLRRGRSRIAGRP